MIKPVAISQEELTAYQRFFFEEICLLSTEGRTEFSCPLPANDRIHFACVQDTVKRLTEETGRLSRFQWRNCIFVPIDGRTIINDIYLETYDWLKENYSSLFIRSYVYLVFIKIRGVDTLELEGLDSKHVPTKDDFQIYVWNTNYDIKREGKTDLFNLESSKKGERDGSSAQSVNNKVFIVSHPANELLRIQDSNSDVIDAARAFLGSLDLIDQTERKIIEVDNALNQSPRSRVLLEGPARSGKTIIAMSLLSRHSNSKMLLMNWFFYDALRDAFRIWGKMDESEIRKLFTADPDVLNDVRIKTRKKWMVETYLANPTLLDAEIKMREWPSADLDRVPRWQRMDIEGRAGFVVTRIVKSKPGDYVFVASLDKGSEGKRTKLELVRIAEVFKDSKTAKTEYPFDYSSRNEHLRIIGDDKSEKENLDSLALLYEIRNVVNSQDASEYIAKLVKDIAEALSKNGQRFFHHDRRKEDGLWVEGGKMLFADSDIILCDEAQRLGNYSEFDEAAALAHHPSPVFLCGDDCQKLNRRGDLGIQRVYESSDTKFNTFELPESVGIPPEIGILVKSLLGEELPPLINCNFRIKLIYDSDELLISEFNNDPSFKKHFALPANYYFYPRGYMPGIKRVDGPTESCDESCGEYCEHRFIPMLSPALDPKGSFSSPRKDLSQSFKFFCAEQIMPNYALSAYELISREVESLYLKIPRFINMSTIGVSINDDEAIQSWIKRHLYVLMTRPTANLVVNIEDKRLFDHFVATCKRADANYVELNGGK